MVGQVVQDGQVGTVTCIIWGFPKCCKTHNITEVIHKDNDENLLVVSLKKGSDELILAAIYRPRRVDNPEFLAELTNVVNLYNSKPIIFAGDFNMITSTSRPLKDVIGSNSIPNEANSKIIEQLINSGYLIDIFRFKKGHVKEYTYMGFNRASQQRSRIDLGLCNKLAICSVKNIKHIILDRNQFDHKAMIIELGGTAEKKITANMGILEIPLIETIVHLSIIETLLREATTGGEEVVNNNNWQLIK